MEKKIITKKLCNIDLEGSLNAVRGYLEEWEKEYAEYDNLRIVEEPAYDGGYYYHLYGDRIETDSEFDSRVLRVKQQQEEQDAREKTQYLLLKAKFEPNENQVS